MTLTELHYLIAVAREKHFGRAAQHCHVSQPTLSMGINKLESKLGVNVFERHHNDIRITEIGKKIVTQAQRVLEEATALKTIANTGRSQLNTPLSIGAIHTVGPYLFPVLLPKLNKIAPQMPLIIQEDFTKNLRNKLQQGQLDLIFISLPFSETSVLTKPLYQEPFVILMKKDHPLGKKISLKNEDLKNENVLLLGEDHCFRKQIIDACPDCQNSNNWQQTIEGTSLETLRHMVASGLGMTILPSSATQIKYYQKTLCVKPFKNSSPSRTIALAWRVSFPRPKAIDAVIKAMQACKFNPLP